MSITELNRLYLAVRYLKMEELRHAITSFLATKVYIGEDPSSIA